MIEWSTILYGAALSAVVAGILVAAVARAQRLAAGLGAAFAAAAGPIAWNAILRATHADNFFTDAPMAVLPASWQDAGSGVFALAAATLVLGAVVLPSIPARHLAAYGALCGAAAFLVDVYLY